MKKWIKIILGIIGILIIIIILDTLQAKIFNNSPLLKIRKNYNDDSTAYIDKGIFINHYYCTNKEEKTLFKGTKYSCPIEEKTPNYDNYKKISELNPVNYASTEILIKFDGILYGKSNSLIEYVGETEKIGIIDKVIENEYVPELNGETNTKEILNAEIHAKTDNVIILRYNNEYVLFEKISE